MTDIAYQYMINSVDAEARCMEVVYMSLNRPTVHISTRLPYVGETLEQIIRMYAPVAYWHELEAEVIIPEVGTQGGIKPDVPVEVNK